MNAVLQLGIYLLKNTIEISGKITKIAVSLLYYKIYTFN